ncbi:hypothetical protein GCM10010219_19950 [Streptomyces netropsis]|nr:hypothetical protein GCM10010219_19950 [Streptomyces netropsis]
MRFVWSYETEGSPNTGDSTKPPTASNDTGTRNGPHGTGARAEGSVWKQRTNVMCGGDGLIRHHAVKACGRDAPGRRAESGRGIRARRRTFDVRESRDLRCAGLAEPARTSADAGTADQPTQKPTDADRRRHRPTQGEDTLHMPDRRRHAAHRLSLPTASTASAASSGGQ